jgi:GTP-binding protein LepA
VTHQVHVQQRVYKVEEVGIFQIKRIPKKLLAGQVGYIIAGIKTVSDTRCGDTITLRPPPATTMPGFKEAKPVVFSSIYPVASDGYEDLAAALENSSSTTPPWFTKRTTSAAWVSAFGAVFWGCCTWRSSRSGWSGNSTCL